MFLDPQLHTWLDIADAVLLAGVHKLLSPCNQTSTVYMRIMHSSNLCVALDALSDVYGMHPLSSYAVIENVRTPVSATSIHKKK